MPVPPLAPLPCLGYYGAGTRVVHEGAHGHQDIEQERLSRLEGTYEQVDRRLNDMNSRLDGMQQTIDGLRSEVNSRLDGMQQTIDRAA